MSDQSATPNSLGADKVANTGLATLSPAIPQLPSGNLQTTLAFMQDKLGFSLHRLYEDQGHLIVRRAVAEIHFWLARSEDEARHYGSASSCYIRVQNIQSLYDEFIARGMTLRYGLTRQPWGMNEMQVDDPYGNAIRFGESVD